MYVKLYVIISVGSTHDRVVAFVIASVFTEICEREVMRMTIYEIIFIIIDFIRLLIASGSFVISILTFLDTRNSKK